MTALRQQRGGAKHSGRGRGAWAQRPQQGLTLIELMAGLAVLAVLGALAVPTLGTRMQHQRLALAAETLAADLGEARFNAARRGQALQLNTHAGSDGHPWCWSVQPVPATQPLDCGCVQARSCDSPTVSSSNHPGVKMRPGTPLRVAPDGTAQVATAAVFESPQGERLRVDVLALGRSRICSPSGAAGRYPAC
jgi:type IV fimbrial biogenesis protein FimT